MRIGDKVRLTVIPPDAKDDGEFNTLTLFRNCLGKIFTVQGFQSVEGLPYPLIQLDVGDIVGVENYMESIYVEPEYLEVLASDPR